MSLSESATADEFLAEVYRLVAAGLSEIAQDIVYDWIDRSLWAGRNAEIDAVLASADPRRLSSSVRRSLLCVTYGTGFLYPSRRRFYDAAWATLAAEQGEDKANRLIGHLRDSERREDAECR